MIWWLLLVMVWLAFQDCHGTIELFYAEESHHLMGERHLGETDFLAGGGIDGRGESVGAADDEDETTGACGLTLLEILAETYAGELATAFVEEDEPVAVGDALEDEFSLPLFLLLGREGLGLTELGDDLELEGNVVAETTDIVVDKGL